MANETKPMKETYKVMGNGALIGGAVAAIYGFYAFGKNDVGRIIGITFLGAVVAGWASGAIANKGNVAKVESQMEG